MSKSSPPIPRVYGSHCTKTLDTHTGCPEKIYLKLSILIMGHWFSWHTVDANNKLINMWVKDQIIADSFIFLSLLFVGSSDSPDSSHDSSPDSNLFVILEWDFSK